MRVKAKSNIHNQTVDESTFPSLTVGKTYVVLGKSVDCLRLLDDGEPYLYPSVLFEVLDSTIPADWILRISKCGDEYWNPEDLSDIGFYEDYFDGVASAVEKFEVHKSKNHF